MTQSPFVTQGSQCPAEVSGERSKSGLDSFTLLAHWPPNPKVGAVLCSDALNLLGFGYLSFRSQEKDQTSMKVCLHTSWSSSEGKDLM